MKKSTLIFLVGIIVVVVIIIIPIVINILFQSDASYSFFEATWTAGDALAYSGASLSFIGTCILSAIALWQNHKFKIENDIVQERLEKISKQANELNIIEKIINHESNRLYNLEILSDKLRESCDSETLLALYETIKTDTSIIPDSMYDIWQLKEEINILLTKISRELRTDPKISFDQPIFISLIQFVDIFSETFDLINQKFKNKSHLPRSQYESLQTALNKFTDELELYLNNLQKKIDKTLYQNLTLAEVQELFDHIEK